MKVINILLPLLLFPLLLFGHEVRPAYFSISQISDSTFQIVWKLPALGNATPKIYPVLPNYWKILDENSNLFDFSSELRFRSKSNVVFKFKEDKYNDTFIKQANDSGIIGINGHRSIGGIRVSLFNSVDQPMFNYFMDFLKKFINESL